MSYLFGFFFRLILLLWRFRLLFRSLLRHFDVLISLSSLLNLLFAHSVLIEVLVDVEVASVDCSIDEGVLLDSLWLGLHLLV